MGNIFYNRVKDFICAPFFKNKEFINNYNYILVFFVYSIVFGSIIASKSTSHFDFILQKYISGIIVFILFILIQILIKSVLFFILSKYIMKLQNKLAYCIRLLTIYTIYTYTFYYIIRKIFLQYYILYIIIYAFLIIYFGVKLFSYLELDKINIKNIMYVIFCCGIIFI